MLVPPMGWQWLTRLREIDVARRSRRLAPTHSQAIGEGSRHATIERKRQANSELTFNRAIGGDARVLAILGVLAGDNAPRRLVTARQDVCLGATDVTVFLRGGRAALMARSSYLGAHGVSVEAMAASVEAILRGQSQIGLAAERLGMNRKALQRYRARYIQGGRQAIQRGFVKPAVMTGGTTPPKTRRDVGGSRHDDTTT